MGLWLGLLYFFVPAALATWIWRWWRALRQPQMEAQQPVQPLKKRFALWFTLGMIPPACFFAMFLYGMLFQCTWTSRTISEAEAQRIVAERKDATFRIEQYENGSQYLWIRLPEDGRRVELCLPADESTLALLARNHIAYSTSVQGRDYGQLGAPWRLLGLLSFFVVPIGAVILLRRPWRHLSRQQETEIRRDERAAKTAFKAFAVSMSLVLLAAGVLLGLVTRWKVHAISSAEAQKLVAGLKGAEYEVFQYDNGSRELWITQHRHPDFIAPADAATLSILAEKGIAYKTYIHSPNFERDLNKPWMSLLGISILFAAAALILWRIRDA